jgi:hypothetical protein
MRLSGQRSERCLSMARQPPIHSHRPRAGEVGGLGGIEGGWKGERVMASIVELAAHMFDLNGFLPSEALAEARRAIQARESPRCPLCEAWLSRPRRAQERAPRLHPGITQEVAPNERQRAPKSLA